VEFAQFLIRLDWRPQIAHRARWAARQAGRGDTGAGAVPRCLYSCRSTKLAQQARAGIIWNLYNSCWGWGWRPQIAHRARWAARQAGRGTLSKFLSYISYQVPRFRVQGTHAIRRYHCVVYTHAIGVHH
jgi:predicted DsbA family dithiol-disulfide isomerase